MSIETGVLVGVDLRPIQWHLPPGRNAGSLPDSRDLWETMWENRHSLLGFAHSHPCGGIPGPSYTDITTFNAIEKALGRQLVWWICSSTDIVVCRQFGKSHRWEATPFDGSGLSWLPELRRLSYTGNPADSKKESRFHERMLVENPHQVTRDELVSQLAHWYGPQSNGLTRYIAGLFINVFDLRGFSLPTMAEIREKEADHREEARRREEDKAAERKKETEEWFSAARKELAHLIETKGTYLASKSVRRIASTAPHFVLTSAFTAQAHELLEESSRKEANHGQ